MGGSVMMCPLCCGKVFDSKPALIEHLKNTHENLSCPICHERYSSVGNLIQHLVECEPDHETPGVQFGMVTDNINKECAVQTLDIVESNMLPVDDGQKDFCDTLTSNIADDTAESNEINRMYVELLSKQLANPQLQKRELKLVNNNGVSQYIILTDDSPSIGDGTAVVTKQNNDGTISMTTVDEMKLEEDSMAAQSQDSPETEEIYSCNTCGVSFTSVLEHIQNYHNNQDVVVEEPVDESNQNTETFEFEIEGTLDEMSNDKVACHRVITETGDIIDTSMLLQSSKSGVEQPIAKESTKSKQKIMKDPKKSKRVIVVDKFCDSFVKNIKEPDESNGPFHKVVIKEIRTDKGQSVKVFNCIACNVYVTGLEDFKSYPCNTLKYSCPHCPVTYNNMASVCGHMKTHRYAKTDGNTALTDFECGICSTKFKTYQSLKRHKRMHDPVKIRPIDPPVDGADGGGASAETYLCSECNKEIPIDYRTIHDNSHKGEQKFNCDICNNKFTSGEYLEMHMTVHNNDKAPVLKEKCHQYVCLYCDRRFANVHEKVKHEQIHTTNGNTVPTDFECEICSTKFKTHKSLKLHKRMHDPVKIRPIEPPVEGADGGVASEDTYLCSECNKEIPIDYRTIHDNSHNSEQKFNCDICNKKFTSGEYLEMHMTVHNNDKVPMSKQEKCHQYVCLYCDRRFAKPHEKVKHERIHTGEKPHSCEICGKSFRVSYCLTLHMRTHTGARPYSCPHCGKRFKAHSVYNHHLLTHSDVRAYKCPFCPKAFKTSVQLAGHKNSHTKPFSCQHCNRPFASLYAVRAHMETHSRQNNLRFSCALCGASYARLFALKDHMLQVHHKVDNPKASEEKMKDMKSVATLTTQIIETDTEDTSTMDKLTQDIEITDLGLMDSNVLTVP